MTWPGPSGSLKSSSHWYVLEETLQWFFPDLTVPIWEWQCWKENMPWYRIPCGKMNLPCCHRLFSDILDQLSLCKYLCAKWCCQCWCCSCLAVTGWCHSAVRWQRSCFRGALSKDYRRTGKCRSAHCTQHRWILKHQMPHPKTLSSCTRP